MVDRASTKTLRFCGCAQFRQRIVCSTLSSRPVRINRIRESDEQPGLKQCEASLLRLMDRLTNGSKIEINETGTSVRYVPGVLMGGSFTHDCGTERAIGYFLEALLPLAPFCKKRLVVRLQGITNDDTDPSIDAMRSCAMPLVKRFGIDANVQLKRRGAPPGGGGEIVFSCEPVRELSPIELVEPGLIKRVRGVAYCTKTSPQFANRMVTSARALLNRLIPDVYIYTDHYTGKEAGESPGYALSLMAETTEGCQISAECAAVGKSMPEDIGDRCSRLLCDEIAKGGCVDTPLQSLALLLMAVSSEVSEGRPKPTCRRRCRCRCCPCRASLTAHHWLRPHVIGGIKLSQEQISDD